MGKKEEVQNTDFFTRLTVTTKQPLLLVIETSTRQGFVGLSLGAKILGTRLLQESRRNARDLAPSVRGLLWETKYSPKDVDGAVVSIGPGSYTGLRVGIISAKAYAYALGCKLMAVETFAAVAQQIPAKADQVDVFADAQQDRVYVQTYRRNSDTLNFAAITDLEILAFEDWLQRPDKSSWVTGPGLKGKESRLPESIQTVAEENRVPTMASLVKLGLQKYSQEQWDDLYSVEPIYLRPSAAEEQWEKNKPQRL